MGQLCVPVPPLDDARTIDLDVTIDGARQRVQYRVETLEWPPDAASRVEALRRFIAAHGEDWLLVQIGTPTEERVPVMFRLRGKPQPEPERPAAP